jgi:hypothetical protein
VGRTSDVKAEDDGGLESVGVEELAHGPPVCCAELVDKQNARMVASVRLSKRRVAMIALRVGRKNYRVGLLLPKYICALTAVRSFASNVIQLERLVEVRPVHLWQRGESYSLA